MNPSPAPAVPANHRARVLRALGVTPWIRREAPLAAGQPQPQRAVSASDGVDCVVVLPHGCSTRELDLLGRALAACGAALARAARVTVSDGGLVAVPEAAAYLVLGEAQAHALGRELPAGVMQRALIVLADEPALLLTRADAKRRLWSALRSLRRALATAGS